MENTIEKTNGGWADRKRAINDCVDKINALTDLSVTYEDEGDNRLDVSDSNAVLRLTAGGGKFNGSVLICINGSPYYIDIPYDSETGPYAPSSGANFPIAAP
tara:strand:- start:96 stop:401 length:306 start_codon:yes stop_codon:yes gene_type:complete